MKASNVTGLLTTLTARGNNQTEWQDMARIALKRIARDERIKASIESDRQAYDLLLGAANRFIGGETLDTCLPIAQAINDAGHAVTIDFMGESTRDATAALRAVSAFAGVIDAIRERRIDSSVSLDLSHIGLAIDSGLALANARDLASATSGVGIELMISAEDSSRTDAILQMHRELAGTYDNVGITLQANLFRTIDDVHAACETPGRIRIVKGAFEESPDVAMPRSAELNDRYLHLVTTLLDRRHRVSIATHDPELLARILPLVDPPDAGGSVEFEMLRGVGEQLLGHVQGSGYRTRLYLPFGTEWYLYLCHRLAEYPPNIYRALADIVDRTRGTSANINPGTG